MRDKPGNPKDIIAVNKLPTWLVSPIVKAYDAIAHFLGNVKYGAWNWRGAGARVSVYKSALDRHMDAFMEGEWYDPTDGTPHLANAKACLNIIIDSFHSGTLIDDRPPSNHKELARLRAEFEAMMPRIREQYKDKAPYHFTIADTPELERARMDAKLAKAAAGAPQDQRELYDGLLSGGIAGCGSRGDQLVWPQVPPSAAERAGWDATDEMAGLPLSHAAGPCARDPLGQCNGDVVECREPRICGSARASLGCRA